MTEITNEQFEKYISEMQSMVGSLNKFLQGAERDRRSTTKKTSSTSSSQSADNSVLSRLLARNHLKDDLHRKKEAKSDEARWSKFDRTISSSVKKVGSSLSYLDGSSRSLGRAFADVTKSFAGMAIIGTVLEGIMDAGEHWVENYREMTEVGQSFNGSMIDMARAAAQAGMPLNDFAAYVKKNAVLMATFGTKDVTGFALKVRKMSRDAGNYGYSIEQMNDLTATWLDIQRLQGNRYAASNTQNIYAVDQMAKRITGLSEAFGVSREEILKNTKALGESGQILVAQIMDPSLKSNEAFKAAQQVMAAFPGEAGDAIRSLFQNQMANGAVWMDSNFQNLFQKVGLNVQGMMDNLDKTIRANGSSAEAGSEAALNAYYDMAEQIQAKSATIRNQATQNPELLKMIQWSADMLSKSRDQRLNDMRKSAAASQQMDKITALFLTISDRLHEIGGKLLDGVLSGLQSFVQYLEPIIEDVAKSTDWKAFAAAAADLGRFMGQILGNLMKSFASTDPKLIVQTIKDVIKVGLAVGTAVMQLAGAALKLILWFQDLGGSIKGAIGAFIAFKLASKFLRNLFGTRVGTMRVAAGSVFVNGKNIGGGGGGGFFGGGEKEGRGGRAGRARGWRARLGGAGEGGGGRGMLIGLAAMAAMGAYDYFSSKSDGGDEASDATAAYDQRQYNNSMLSATLEGNDIARDQSQTLADWRSAGINQVAVDSAGRPLNIQNGTVDTAGLLADPATKRANAKKKLKEKKGDDPDTWINSILTGLMVGLPAVAGIYMIRKMTQAWKDQSYASTLERTALQQKELRASKARLKDLYQESRNLRNLDRASPALDAATARSRAARRAAIERAIERERMRVGNREARLNESKEKLRAKRAGGAGAAGEKPGIFSRIGGWFSGATKWLGETAIGKAVGTAWKKVAGSGVGRAIGKGAGYLGKGLGYAGGAIADVGIESLGYLFGDKAWTWKNAGKSLIRLLGGGIGGLLGSLTDVVTGPLGTIGGGIAGYAGGDWLAQALLGDDDLKSDQAKPKTPGAPNPDGSPGGGGDGVDPDADPATFDDEAQDTLLSDSRRTADLLEQRLPSPEVSAVELQINAEMLKTLVHMNAVQEGMLKRMWEEGNQLHDIWSVLNSIQTNTKK